MGCCTTMSSDLNERTLPFARILHRENNVFYTEKTTTEKVEDTYSVYLLLCTNQFV